MMPLLTGMVRYHSTTNDEFDICEKCHSEDLEKTHKFQKFVVEKDNFPKDGEHKDVHGVDFGDNALAWADEFS